MSDVCERCVQEFNRIMAEGGPEMPEGWDAEAPEPEVAESSPMGETREHSVLCLRCRRVYTWNWNAVCHDCQKKEG